MLRTRPWGVRSASGDPLFLFGFLPAELGTDHDLVADQRLAPLVVFGRQLARQELFIFRFDGLLPALQVRRPDGCRGRLLSFRQSPYMYPFLISVQRL